MDGETHSLDMNTIIDRLTSLAQESSIFPRVTTERMVVPDRILEELEALVPDDRLTHERFWGRMESVSRSELHSRARPVLMLRYWGYSSSEMTASFSSSLLKDMSIG